VLGFLDDDPVKWKRTVSGSRVLGPGRELPRLLDLHGSRVPQIEEVVIAMPGATGRQMREAVANCRAAGLTCKTIPSTGELLSGKVLTGQIRNLSLEICWTRAGATRRKPHPAGPVWALDPGYGRCRFHRFGALPPDRRSPSRVLVVFDQAESDLYRIDLELRDKFPNVVTVPEVGDIRDLRRVEEVLGRHHINSIFHAAAYKHVPMMEANIVEAAKNNIIGTWNMVQAALRGASLISS